MVIVDEGVDGSWWLVVGREGGRERWWVVGLPAVAVECKWVGKPMCRVAMSKELRVYSKMNNEWIYFKQIINR